MSDPLQTLFRGDSWNFPGLKEGQILRTISNVTYSDSHYTSDEEKLGEALRRSDFQDLPMEVAECFDSLTPRLEMPLSLEAAACTLSMAGAGPLEHGSKGQQQLLQSAVLSEAIKQTSGENSHAVFDMVVNAGGSLPARDIQQNFCLRSECSGAFADALNSIDFSAGGTLSPKLLQQQLGNLSHLFDDLDKASSDMLECPDTPLQMFPVTPTSGILMQNHFNQCLPEAPTPPLTTPSRKLPYGLYGSQQLSLESMANSPGSSLMGPSCSLRGAHSMPLPMHGAPSPQGPRIPAPVHPMDDRTMSLPLPPVLEPQMYLPPIRTSLKPCASPKPSPSRPSGIRKVQGGKPKARRVLLSEDSISMSTTDSEADSMLADSGAAKRKPGAKKGSTRRTRRMTCRNCGAHQTPQWRCGPEGPRTLCNACGVRYKKGLPLICTVPKGSLPPLPNQEPETPVEPAVPGPLPMEVQVGTEIAAEASSAGPVCSLLIQAPMPADSRAGPVLPGPELAVPMATEAGPAVL